MTNQWLEKSSLPSESVDKTQLLWVELMLIMKACNDHFFTTRDQTIALIQSGDYIQRLGWLQPQLHAWKNKFNVLDGNVSTEPQAAPNANLCQVPKHARSIISIEYHYISMKCRPDIAVVSADNAQASTSIL